MKSFAILSLLAHAAEDIENCKAECSKCQLSRKQHGSAFIREYYNCHKEIFEGTGRSNPKWLQVLGGGALKTGRPGAMRKAFPEKCPQECEQLAAAPATAAPAKPEFLVKEAADPATAAPAKPTSTEETKYHCTTDRTDSLPTLDSADYGDRVCMEEDYDYYDYGEPCSTFGSCTVDYEKYETDRSCDVTCNQDRGASFTSDSYNCKKI